MDTKIRDLPFAASHDVAYPTGVADNDLLVFFVGMHDVPRHVLFPWTNHRHGGVKGFGEDTGLQVAWKKIGSERTMHLTYEYSTTDHHLVSAAPVIMILHLVRGTDFKAGSNYGISSDVTKRGFSQADPTDTVNPGPANIAYDPIDTPSGTSETGVVYFASWYETGNTIASYTKPSGWTLVRNYQAANQEYFSMWSKSLSAASTVTPGNTSVTMKADADYPAGYYNMNNHVISCGFVATTA